MPIETRYFRNSQSTVNGLLAYDLLTTNTTLPAQVYIGHAEVAGTAYIGIRVWKRSSAGVETEITSGIAVAIAQLLSGLSGWFQIYSTWSAILTALNPTDSLVVRVYGDVGITPPITLLRTFQTEQLGASQLNVTTWTVYYWIHRIRTWDFDLEIYVYDWFFVHGSTAYNSRITNFSWTTGIAPAVFQLQIDGLVMIQT